MVTKTSDQIRLTSYFFKWTMVVKVKKNRTSTKGYLKMIMDASIHSSFFTSPNSFSFN